MEDGSNHPEQKNGKGTATKGSNFARPKERTPTMKDELESKPFRDVKRHTERRKRRQPIHKNKNKDYGRTKRSKNNGTS